MYNTVFPTKLNMINSFPALYASHDHKYKMVTTT